MQRRQMGALLIVGLATPAFACGPGEKSVMACTTTKGKRVEICQTGDKAVYSFGKQGSPPELTIADNGKNFRWYSSYGTHGGGEAFQFTKGPYVYTFERYEYRGTDDEGKLTVKKNGKQIAELRCVEKSIPYDIRVLTREESEAFD